MLVLYSVLDVVAKIQSCRVGCPCVLRIHTFNTRVNDRVSARERERVVRLYKKKSHTNLQMASLLVTRTPNELRTYTTLIPRRHHWLACSSMSLCVCICGEVRFECACIIVSDVVVSFAVASDCPLQWTKVRNNELGNIDENLIFSSM